MSAAPLQTTIVQNGLVIDADTGEIIGVAKEAFTVDSADAADWVLEKMQRAHSAIGTIRANAEAMCKAHQRELDWLTKRFGPELEQFAKGELDGKRTRTLQLFFGALSFRATKGTNKIVDMAAAVEYCRERDPELIHVTEAVNVSELLAKFPDIVKVDASEDGSTVQCEVTFIEATGPRESFSIKLGAKEAREESGE